MPVDFIDPSGFTPSPGYAHVGIVTGGRLVYVSGQIAYDAGNRLVGKGDLRAQTERVFENLAACLGAAGAGFKDVVKINTYVVGLDPARTGVVREVRSRFFAGHRPTSTMVGVTALVDPELLVEVEVVALVPDAQ